MTPQHIISQLLESDIKYPQNLELLKKIILVTYLGRLRINGLAPDNKIALGNYIFDDERMMFDLSRLSDEKKELFNQWLLGPHQQDKKRVSFSAIRVNEDRGIANEERLGWWETFTNWLDGGQSEQWKIADFELSLNYQLTGIELCHGERGLLIGFNQHFIPSSGGKYKDPDDNQSEPLGNTKRVIITNRLVEQLTQVNIKNIRPESVCKSAHPQAIDILNPNARYEEMSSYRKTQSYNKIPPWYVRLWNWITSWPSSWFAKEEVIPPKLTPVDHKLILLYENETTKVYQRTTTQEIIVFEQKPDIENLVFCGGGEKIFAHIGVWKALNEANITPTRFAGSSAGAIMAMLCYLGYTADEIEILFRNFKQEHIVHYDIDFDGLSGSESIKTGLDYAVTNKLKEIVIKYGIPFPKGTITFKTLESIRLQCPGCGLGSEITVTSTNRTLRKTSYFSLARSPDMELTKAVELSAKFPVVFKAEVIDGEAHNDGGILSNFPTEVFSDDHSTLLESEHGNNLKVLAVQFDNGTERTAIDRIMEEVYRENAVLNAVYGMLTGVNDPASAWVRDRLKLRQYAHQTIVPNVDDIPVSGFSVPVDSQIKMIQRGYEPTVDHLTVRYGQKEGFTHKNQELMYSTFSSLGDLLAYCCYRGDKHWFEIVNNLILQSTLPNRPALMKKSLELRNLYFSASTTSKPEKQEHTQKKPVTFFGNSIPTQNDSVIDESHHNALHALYPIFLKLTSDLVQTDSDKSILMTARHSLRLHAPFKCLDHFNRISNKNHIILHIFINLIKALKDNPDPEIYDALKELEKMSFTTVKLLKPDYYDKWDLSLAQSLRVLKKLNNGEHASASQLLSFLRDKIEPMQVIKDGTFYDDFSEPELAMSSTNFSMSAL
ncbi:Dot/Icm T4SS effector VpdC [uncultured Legionella sp.]|uniref:Dot/Icm T4SS effector VpdC n=1 Tax=uncultured Legionella sp. TaxID=210934 RepID=UPI0026144A7F|nr:Dot/Icm T4SS effector VpdC [uncultured Legionella sp.]